MPMFQSELRWPRRGFSGVLTQSHRVSEEGWTDHGVKTDKTWVDNRLPLELNKPEVRRTGRST
jgi:hypothetical protein